MLNEVRKSGSPKDRKFQKYASQDNRVLLPAFRTKQKSFGLSDFPSFGLKNYICPNQNNPHAII